MQLVSQLVPCVDLTSLCRRSLYLLVYSENWDLPSLGFGRSGYEVSVETGGE